MELKVGQLVYSKAGRDRGKFLAVTKISDCGVYVADGDRSRRAGMRDGTTRKGRADRKNAAQFNAIPHS